MDYTSVSLRLHAPCSDRNKMNCILWLCSGSFFPFFPSLHQCECIFPSLYMTKHGLNAGLFSSFEPPHNHSICYVSLRGRFLFISQWSGWLRDHVYVWIFTLRKWYFRLGLACFGRLRKRNLPSFCSMHNKPKQWCVQITKSRLSLYFCAHSHRNF